MTGTGLLVASTTMPASRTACSALSAGRASTPSSSRARWAKRSLRSPGRLQMRASPSARTAQMAHSWGPGLRRRCRSRRSVPRRAVPARRRRPADGPCAARAELVADGYRLDQAGAPVVDDYHLRPGVGAEGVVGAVAEPVRGARPGSDDQPARPEIGGNPLWCDQNSRSASARAWAWPPRPSPGQAACAARCHRSPSGPRLGPGRDGGRQRPGLSWLHQRSCTGLLPLA